MAIVNGVDVNRVFIEKIFNEVKRLFVPVESGIPDLKVVGDNLYIRKSDLALYNSYRELTRLLSFTNRDSSELYFFDSLTLRTSDFETFSKIIYGSGLFDTFEKELKDFENYGKMPGYSYNAPIPKQRNQSIDDYEKYLEGYYGKHGFVVDKDKNGIRKPYPHELFKWSRGIAMSQNGIENNYVAPYYQEYISYMSNRVQRVNNSNSNRATGSSTSTNTNDMNNGTYRYSRPNNQAASQTNQNTATPNQNGTNTQANAAQTQTTQATQNTNNTGRRRYKVRSRRPIGSRIWDAIMGAPDSYRSFVKHLDEDHVWENIKSFIKRHALHIIAVAAGLGIAGGAIYAAVNAFATPGWAGLAVATGASNPAIAGTILATIFTNAAIMAVPVALVVAYVKLRQRWLARRNQEEQEQQQTQEHNNVEENVNSHNNTINNTQAFTRTQVDPSYDVNLNNGLHFVQLDNQTLSDNSYQFTNQEEESPANKIKPEFDVKPNGSEVNDNYGEDITIQSVIDRIRALNESIAMLKYKRDELFNKYGSSDVVKDIDVHIEKLRTECKKCLRQIPEIMKKNNVNTEENNLGGSVRL